MRKLLKQKEDYLLMMRHCLKLLEKENEAYTIQAWMRTLAAHAQRCLVRINQMIVQLESKGEL